MTLQFFVAFSGVLAALSLWCVILHFGFKRFAFRTTPPPLPSRKPDELWHLPTVDFDRVDADLAALRIHTAMKAATFSTPASKGFRRSVTPVIEMKGRPRVH